MRLAIADPPYPRSRAAGGSKRRGSRWYGRPVSSADRVADSHPEVSRWDDPASHRELLAKLQTYDGWALATSPDGIEVYAPLPPEVRIMSWHKPNGQPGAHRLRSCWEPVIVFPPPGRRSNRHGRGAIPDVLVAPAPRVGFVGAKPEEWTRWVLAALSFDPKVDTVEDLFPGSGAISAVVAMLDQSKGGG